MSERVGQRGHVRHLFVHGVSRRRVLGEEQRQLLPPKVVQSFAQSADQERRREFLVAQALRVVMQPVQRLDGEHERPHEDDRDGDEANPRASNARSLVCEERSDAEPCGRLDSARMTPLSGGTVVPNEKCSVIARPANCLARFIA